MERTLAVNLTMAATASFAQSRASLPEPPKPIPRSYFETIRDLPRSSWGDLNRMVGTIEACSKKDLKVPLCEKASDGAFEILWQAFHRIMGANILAKNKGFTTVCDAYAAKLIVDAQYGPQASHALLLIDEHMQVPEQCFDRLRSCSDYA